MEPKTEPKMEPRVLRNNLPYTLHLRKNKYYVSVNAPNEIKHLYPDGRKRVSSGTNDKRIANERASQIVDKIMDDFDAKRTQLEPFIEACRPYLIKSGVDVQRWYTERKMTVTLRGEESTWVRHFGQRFLDSLHSEVVYDLYESEFEMTMYSHIVRFLTIKGFAIPRAAYLALDDEQKALMDKWMATKKEDVLKVKPLMEAMQNADLPKVKRYMAEVKLNNYDDLKIDVPTVEDAPEQTYKFSDLIEPYLESRKNEAVKEVTSRRLACERVIEHAGDLPLAEYQELHAYDVAQAMAADDYANRTIRKNLTYANGLFRFARKNRDEFGRQYLKNLPWIDLELKEYGKESEPYLPLSEDELMSLFALDMGQQERVLLSMLITTGMRLDEAALMTWERVDTHKGVWCFSLVNDQENVLVKNRGSMRYIPVPDVLKPIIGNGGEGRLFNYRIDQDGKAQAKASDAVMALIRKVTSNKRKVAHSLRGNFKDLVRDLEVTKEINDFITGHAQGDVAGKYGAGPSMQKRLEVVNKIKHPWLTKQ